MLLLFCLILNASFICCRVLNPNGPTHQHYATACVMGVIRNNFLENETLLTALLTANLSTKAWHIQEKVLIEINKESKWVIETISGKQKNFKSAKICVNCPLRRKNEKKIIKHNFQLLYKSRYCVMIIDDMEQLEYGLKHFLQSQTYNYHVYFFVYIANVVPNYEKVAQEVLNLLLNYKIVRAVVLTPCYSLTTFCIFNLNVFAPSEYCGEKAVLELLETCKKGVLPGKKLFFENKLPETFSNCSIKTVAMRYPPFVINKREGFEIKILKELGKILNIRFEIEVENAGDWGTRVSPKNWSGSLQNVFKNSAIAIGNIIPHPDYALDFDLSIAYFYEYMVWVVPTALPIPRWKNIFVIFSFDLWLCCFGFFIAGALFSYMLSHFVPGEYLCYKNLSINFMVTLSVLVGTSVFKQPKTLGTRSIFIATATLGMFLAVLYQTLLISHLLNPVYERQVESVEDIFDFGMGIGGIKSYKEFFDEPDDKRAMAIYDIFELYDEGNDTAYNWLITVANDRDTCTLSSLVYVNYLISVNRSDFVNRDGKDKIYILKKIIFSYPVRMIQPRGFPLGVPFDNIIWKLVNGGIIKHWAERYKIRHHTDESDKKDSGLTLSHVQGAFMLLFFGNAFATFAFFSELILNQYHKRAIKIRFIRFVNEIVKKFK